MMYNPLMKMVGDWLDRLDKWMGTINGKFYTYIVFSATISFIVSVYTDSLIWCTVTYFALVIPMVLHMRKITKNKK